MIKRAPQRVLVPVAAWHSTGPGAARGRLFICQKRPDQDPANRNPYGGERPRQKRDLGRGTDATAMLWMNVVDSKENTLHIEGNLCGPFNSGLISHPNSSLS